MKTFLKLIQASGFKVAIIFLIGHFKRKIRAKLTSSITPQSYLASLNKIESEIVISVIVPVYNSPRDVLLECINSVREQTYSNWELCICDDSSTSKDTIEVLERVRGIDPRIKVVFSENNGGISVASNIAAEQATGDFIGFLDHDDTLDTRALEIISGKLSIDNEIDFLYTDEDKIDFNGEYVDPYYKPDWSNEHLLSVMYTLHFTVVRKQIFWELDGLRSEFSGAQDYDFALRAVEKCRKIEHVPVILYHWRKIDGSASAEVDAKPYALERARNAVQEAMLRRGINGKVEDGLLPGTFRAKPNIMNNPEVTLLILTDARRKDVENRGDILLIENFIQSILEKSTYDNYKILVVDNGNLPNEITEWIKSIGGVVVNYQYEPPFNFSLKMNYCLKQVKTEHVILLNDDLEVIEDDWIESLLEWSQQKDIGAVGAKLLFPNNTVQHAGVVLGVNGSVAHVFHGTPEEPPGYYGYSHLIRNYSVVTGAVLATKMSVINEVGGFDPDLRIDFNDIDFNLKIKNTGRRIVFTPYSKLYHFEGATEARTTQSESDTENFMSRWCNEIKSDSFYNPNLPSSF